mmetsp:Transcript_23862/g.59273  ORF Transcript_23862/g.59273 Transcript_23862/m.59273 type:complete len:311 (+) Transcript_23862:163-1095(+)
MEHSMRGCGHGIMASTQEALYTCLCCCTGSLRYSCRRCQLGSIVPQRTFARRPPFFCLISVMVHEARAQRAATQQSPLSLMPRGKLWRSHLILFLRCKAPHNLDEPEGVERGGGEYCHPRDQSMRQGDAVLRKDHLQAVEEEVSATADSHEEEEQEKGHLRHAEEAGVSPLEGDERLAEVDEGRRRLVQEAEGSQPREGVEPSRGGVRRNTNARMEHILATVQRRVAQALAQIPEEVRGGEGADELPCDRMAAHWIGEDLRVEEGGVDGAAECDACVDCRHKPPTPQPLLLGATAVEVAIDKAQQRRRDV